jgi:hypothetical protein
MRIGLFGFNTMARLISPWLGVFFLQELYIAHGSLLGKWTIKNTQCRKGIAHSLAGTAWWIHDITMRTMCVIVCVCYDDRYSLLFVCREPRAVGHISQHLYSNQRWPIAASRSLGLRGVSEVLVSPLEAFASAKAQSIGLVSALRPQTPKHIRGGWSHYTDTSEPVDGGVLW